MIHDFVIKFRLFSRSILFDDECAVAKYLFGELSSKTESITRGRFHGLDYLSWRGGSLKIVGDMGPCILSSSLSATAMRRLRLLSVRKVWLIKRVLRVLSSVTLGLWCEYRDLVIPKFPRTYEAEQGSSLRTQQGLQC